MLLKNKTLKDILIIVFSTLLITMLIWVPHVLKISNFWGLNFSDGFNTILRNFDGLEYIIIAKSLYNPLEIAKLPQSLPDIYYAAHFPGYSLLILLFSPILGFLKSMLFVSVLSTIGAVISFYFLLKTFNLTKHPVLLSIIFLILPARWLIIHSIGSSEPTFIFFVILSIYYLMKYELTSKKINIFLTGIFGLLAQITRPPGVLLFIALGIYVIWKLFNQKDKAIVWKKVSKISLISNLLKYYPLLLIPSGLLLIFAWFNFTYNDFFAYFHSGDNIHLTFLPFQVFNKNEFWVGDIWLEDIIYIFILSLLGGIYLFRQKLYPMSFFVLTYVIASIMIAHRDISRYLIPIFPFILIAFEKVLTSKEFRIVLVIIALGIYLYAQNFILNNTAPFPNLEAFN